MALPTSDGEASIPATTGIKEVTIFFYWGWEASLRTPELTQIVLCSPHTSHSGPCSAISAHEPRPPPRHTRLPPRAPYLTETGPTPAREKALQWREEADYTPLSFNRGKQIHSE